MKKKSGSPGFEGACGVLFPAVGLVDDLGCGRNDGVLLVPFDLALMLNFISVDIAGTVHRIAFAYVYSV